MKYYVVLFPLSPPPKSVENICTHLNSAPPLRPQSGRHISAVILLNFRLCEELVNYCDPKLDVFRHLRAARFPRARFLFTV